MRGNGRKSMDMKEMEMEGNERKWKEMEGIERK